MPLASVILLAVCILIVVLVCFKRRTVVLATLVVLGAAYFTVNLLHREKTFEVIKLSDSVKGKVVFVAHNPWFGGNDGYLVLKLADSESGESTSMHLASGYDLRNSAEVRVEAIDLGKVKVFEDTNRKAWEVDDGLQITPSTWTENQR